MSLDLINILVFLSIGIGFVYIASIVVPAVLAPSRPSTEKLLPYECGEIVVGEPWVRFHIRYYIFALLFLIFDVEVAFMLPWAVLLKGTLGTFGFWEMMVFIVILVLGLIYPWKKGLLKWAS